MPKQEFDWIDYSGALAVGAVFAIVLTVLTIFINFTFIGRADEITAFEKVFVSNG